MFRADPLEVNPQKTCRYGIFQPDTTLCRLQLAEASSVSSSFLMLPFTPSLSLEVITLTFLSSFCKRYRPGGLFSSWQQAASLSTQRGTQGWRPRLRRTLVSSGRGGTQRGREREREAGGFVTLYNSITEGKAARWSRVSWTLHGRDGR